jgi:hypothetical protein
MGLGARPPLPAVPPDWIMRDLDSNIHCSRSDTRQVVSGKIFKYIATRRVLRRAALQGEAG